MLSTSRLMFLGLAILLSGATVFLTQQWLQGELRRAATSAGAQRPASAASRVLVAGQPLSAGTILKPEHLRWQAWPADVSTAGYLTSASTTPQQMAGGVVRTELGAGEPLTPSRVVQPGDRSFLAAVLQPGYRAVTVNVSASSGVGGFAFPGDRVDLILSRAISGSGESRRFVSETVITDIRLVGMDQRVANEKREVAVPQTATLEVTPKQAEVVAVASELGKLSLSLRSLASAEEPAVVAHAVTRTWDNEATATPRSMVAPARSRATRLLNPSLTAPATPTVLVIRGSQAASAGAVQ